MMNHRWLVPTLCTFGLVTTPPVARAQDTYIDVSSTVDTALPARLYVGTNTTNAIIVNLVTGGSVGFNAYADNNSTLNVSGGSVANNILLTKQARLNLTAGSVGGGIEATENSVTSISGGTVDRGVTGSGNAIVDISGGNFGGVSGYDITGSGTSLVTVTGGIFTGRGIASQGATVNILGGAFAGDLRAVGNTNDLTQTATLNLHGGTFGGVLVTSGTNGILNIFGVDLQLLNPTEVTDGTQYDLLGTLEDGTSLAGKNLLVTSNGVVNLIPAGSASAPEPASVALLAFALLPLAIRLKRRSTTRK